MRTMLVPMERRERLKQTSDEGEKHRDFSRRDKSHSVVEYASCYVQEGDGSLHVKQFTSSSITRMKMAVNRCLRFIHNLIDFIKRKVVTLFNEMNCTSIAAKTIAL